MMIPIHIRNEDDNAAVALLAMAMVTKLKASRAKGRRGWDTSECSQQHLSDLLRGHVDKGDPVDVANFCAFLLARGENIAPAHVHATQLAGQGHTPERQRMTAGRASFFMERFLKEEKLLGPNEQAALHFVIDMLAAPAQAQEDARDAAGFTRGFNAATCVALQVLRGAGDTDSASWREILNAAGRAEVENYARNIAPENWKLCGFAQLDAARAAQGGAA